jgi:alpha-L-fucosidase 2
VAATVSLSSPHAGQKRVDGRTIVFDGRVSTDGMRFQIRAAVLTHGGSARPDSGGIVVTGADAVTIIVAIGTGLESWRSIDGDPEGPARHDLDKAGPRSYEDLRKTHVGAYRRQFDRVSLDLGRTDAADNPTDERVAAFDGGNDPSLPALYFQFGRYLLISSSQPGGQPANLQGKWNDSVNPPWDSKYTININTEMNYWLAGPGNLLECYDPLFAMIDDLSVSGRETATEQYGAAGWVAHHNTDMWRGTAPVDGPFWGMWPTGGAWLCKSLWDHSAFTGDQAVVVAHYPALRGAVEFFLDALMVEPKRGWLVTCPSISPENPHHPDVSICAGPTMDMEILRDLFENFASVSERMDVDGDLRARAVDARGRLAPLQIGSFGQLQEWLEDWDAGAPDQHHRHVSHLYGLYPSFQITAATPDLFAAARTSLERRGDESTGWSTAWKINLWARLRDGDRAYKLLSYLLTPEHTAPNLFDLHPPFQIDGNFGAAAGIAEMLLQSHGREIHLLPALPSAWPVGSVTGLLARGGFAVDIAWKGGTLTAARIYSHAGEPCGVRWREAEIDLSLPRGRLEQVAPDESGNLVRLE